MKQIKLLVALLLMITLIGCSGTGLNKKATMMPDEVWLSMDADPHEDGSDSITEITGGLKWKLK